MVSPKATEPPLQAKTQEPLHQTRQAWLRPISGWSRYDHVVEQTNIGDRIPKKEREQRKIQKIDVAGWSDRIGEKAPYHGTADEQREWGPDL
jgi:hypothetical protein